MACVQRKCQNVQTDTYGSSNKKHQTSHTIYYESTLSMNCLLNITGSIQVFYQKKANLSSNLENDQEWSRRCYWFLVPAVLLEANEFSQNQKLSCNPQMPCWVVCCIPGMSSYTVWPSPVDIMKPFFIRTFIVSVLYWARYDLFNFWYWTDICFLGQHLCFLLLKQTNKTTNLMRPYSIFFRVLDVATGLI